MAVATDAGQYQGVTYFFNHVTNHVMVEWRGQNVDRKLRNVTERFLMSIFKESAEEESEEDMTMTLSDVRSLQEAHTLPEPCILRDPLTTLIPPTAADNYSTDFVEVESFNETDTDMQYTEDIKPPIDFSQPLEEDPVDIEVPLDILSTFRVNGDVDSSSTESSDTEADVKPLLQTLKGRPKPAALRTYSKRKTYQCRKCPKTFAFSIGLSQHIKRFHGTGQVMSVPLSNGVKKRGRKRKVPAKDPPEISADQSDVAKPECQDLSSNDVKASKVRKACKKLCIDCGKHFWNLKIHMRKHTGEKPFPCSYCEKHFTSGPGLQQHLRTVHFKLKKFRKNTISVPRPAERPAELTAEQSVETPAELPAKQAAKHPAKHLAKRPAKRPALRQRFFECKLCKRKFGTKSALDTHTRLHTGEKPFMCRICKETFTYYQSMQRHVINFHLERDGRKWLEYKKQHSTKSISAESNSA